MKTVVMGYLGTKLDAGADADRWSHWRPTVSVCQHDDFVVDRFELLIEKKSRKLADTIAEDISAVSPETEVRMHDVSFRDPWDFEEVYETLHAFSRRYPFDPESEDYLVHITTGTHVLQICLFLLTESRHLPARLMQTSPPRKRDKGSAGRYEFIDLDLSRYDRLTTRFEQEQQSRVSFLKGGIDTRNVPFNELIDRIEHVALSSPAPMLLTGPTGAGKSHLARRIYELRRNAGRVSGEFVEVNCAMLRGDQAMSALFGHVKGAFTGAMQSRPGLLRSADSGMLFLDEIGELGSDEQAMLLRAIEEKRFLPVGADQEVTSDFQLLAGTNRDLRSRVREGRFREDLLARIDLWTFQLPGLAQRREDIAPNVDFELDRYAAGTGRRVRFTREARKAFLAFAGSPGAVWQANFRDLNAAITRMATLAPSGRIQLETVADEVARLQSAWADGPADGVLRSVLGEAVDQLDEFDRAQLEHVASVCRRSRSLAEAGRRLFNVSRQAKKQPNDSDRLRKYLARFGLAFADLTAPPT